VNFNERGRTVR